MRAFKGLPMAFVSMICVTRRYSLKKQSRRKKKARKSRPQRAKRVKENPHRACPCAGLCGHRGKKISYLSQKRASSPQNKSDSPQAMTNFMMP